MSVESFVDSFCSFSQVYSMIHTLGGFFFPILRVFRSGGHVCLHPNQLFGLPVFSVGFLPCNSPFPFIDIYSLVFFLGVFIFVCGVRATW